MLTSSQITLPPTHPLIMEREAILRARKKWDAFAAFGRMPAFRGHSRRRVTELDAQLSQIEAHILTAQSR